MGKVIMSGIVPPLKVPVSYKANFADNDWATIIDACQKNAVPDTWLVGDQKAMTINGTDYLIDIIGKNHDDYADGSGKAPLTFQMHDLYGTTYQMNSSNTNSGGWTECEMRKTHLPEIMSFMPVEVQNGIKAVNKLTSAGSQSTSINNTAEKLFLLSEIEFFGMTNYSASGEGSQYDYYKAGNSHVKMLNGSKTNHWERSPNKQNTVAFCCVGTGTPGYNGYAASNSFGVAFAFCF